MKGDSKLTNIIKKKILANFFWYSCRIKKYLWTRFFLTFVKNILYIEIQKGGKLHNTGKHWIFSKKKKVTNQEWPTPHDEFFPALRGRLWRIDAVDLLNTLSIYWRFIAGDISYFALLSPRLATLCYWRTVSDVPRGADWNRAFFYRPIARGGEPRVRLLPNVFFYGICYMINVAIPFPILHL